jgi:hypothetical protein
MPKRLVPPTGRQKPENISIHVKNELPGDPMPVRLRALAQELQQRIDERARHPARQNHGAGKLKH